MIKRIFLLLTCMFATIFPGQHEEVKVIFVPLEDRPVLEPSLDLGVLFGSSEPEVVDNEFCAKQESGMYVDHEELQAQLINRLTMPCLVLTDDRSNSVHVVKELEGNMIASGYSDGTVNIWNCTTGNLVGSLKADLDDQTAQDRAQEFSDQQEFDDNYGFDNQGYACSKNIRFIEQLDGSRMVTGSDDGSICIWDYGRGQLLVALEGHSQAITALAVLPDGSIVSGSKDGTVCVWDGSGQLLHTLHGHTDSVTALAVFPDGRIVSGSDDCTICVWNSCNGQLLCTLEGHKSGISTLAVLPGDRLVSGSQDSTLKTWNSTDGKLLAEYTEHAHDIFSLALLPNGNIVSGSNRRICISSPSGRSLSLFGQLYNMVISLCVTRDGKIVSSSSYKGISIFDTEKKAAYTICGNYCVESLQLLSDGRIMGACEDCAVRVWDLPTYESQLNTIEYHKKAIPSLLKHIHDRVVNDRQFDVTRCIRNGKSMIDANNRGHRVYNILAYRQIHGKAPAF